MSNSIFASVVANFKKTLVPVRDEKLGIYLPTGDIAKAVKPAKGEEVSAYRVFINGTLTEVPATLVSTKIPVLRINKPVAQLVAGDVIRTGNDGKYTYRYINEVLDNGTVKTTSYNGSETSAIHAVADLLTGTATISCAINLMKGFNFGAPAQGGVLGQATGANLLPLMMLGGDDDLFDGDGGIDKLIMLGMLGGQNAGNMQSLLPLILLDGDKKGGKLDMKTLMMMQMFSGQQPAGSFNPMMFMLMGGDSDTKSFEDILMFQAMSGIQGGTNPFANLFQGLIPAGNPVATAPATAE